MTEHDPLDIHAEERLRAEKSSKERIARENEEADIRWLMSSKRGRRTIWRLLDQSGVFRLSFNPNAMQMAFAEGNRNFGNRTLSLIHLICPELYPVMVKEQSIQRENADGTGRTSNQ
jgi:hypothetical protein